MRRASISIEPKDFVSIILLLLCILSFQRGKLFANSPEFVDKLFVFLPLIVSFIFLIYVFNQKREKDNQIMGDRYIRLFVPYVVLTFAVTFVALIFNPTFILQYGRAYWTRFVSTLLQRITPFLLVYCMILNNRERCLKCIVKALEIDGAIIIVNALIKTGLVNTLCAFLCPFGVTLGAEASELLEVHEATFAIGMLLLYYLFFHDNTRKDKFDIVLLSVLFLVGNKRIGLAAFAVSFVFALFFRKILSKKTWIFLAICGIGISFAFLAIIYNETFMNILRTRGIDSMGRNLVWPYFTRRSHFGLNYFGAGWASTSKIIENMDRSEVLNMVAVRGIHNDFLKLYFEYGFVGFFLWLSFYLIYLPKNIGKMFDNNGLKIYFICIIYAFITYLTDNTEGYPIFQSILLILPALGNITDNKMIFVRRSK